MILQLHYMSAYYVLALFQVLYMHDLIIQLPYELLYYCPYFAMSPL